MSDTELDIRCRPDDESWVCELTVGDDPGATRHRVAVRRETLERLSPGRDSPDELVETSFRFLLEREPREAILASFDLEVIGRYFPEWEAEMGRGA